MMVLQLIIIGMVLFIFQKGNSEVRNEKARRVNIEFASPKNTFKKIKCLDVLRYVTYKDGKRVDRMDGDGLVIHIHITHDSQLMRNTVTSAVATVQRFEMKYLKK